MMQTQTFLLQICALVILIQNINGLYLQEREQCDENTVISKLGTILCHYSAINYQFATDLSGNGNDLTSENMNGLSPDSVNQKLYQTQQSGYIKFPTACNLPYDGYTLFTASMPYGANPQGSRAFGSCADNSFVSGWYEPSPNDFDGVTNSYPRNIWAIRSDGPYKWELAHTKYTTNGWIIASDKMNSLKINGAEITLGIPVYSQLKENVEMCFNYVNGASTNSYFRIREYIVFDGELSDQDTRCVSEYIYDKYNDWQMLKGLAPFIQSQP
eukprot:487201_1